MIDEHLVDNRKENYCLHCGAPSDEVVATISGGIGCEHCTQECKCCEVVEFKEDQVYYERLVKTYEKREIIWDRGMVCITCDGDEDMEDRIKLSPSIFDTMSVFNPNGK